MPTLFSNNNSDNGYRLHYLEIFNWGTFNGKVYKLQPDGRTSLLTGANGSGKTTLIDALLTILVPTSKRFYNQSSGAESKKERDENSYFWGYYGKTYSESEDRSKTEQLRHKSENPYSVLLACFKNAGTQHTISLVQVRWYHNGGLQKVFIVSPYQLNINDHFGENRFDLKGTWRKKLKSEFGKTEFYNSFKEYATRFSDIFGLKDKALSLFSKTVGIKVLGELTNFIRQDMLEESDAEEQFKSLYDQYSDLLVSHKAIQKDEKQLELLNPIIIKKEKLQVERSGKSDLDLIEEQMPFFLNEIEFRILSEDLRQMDREIEIAQEKERLSVEKIEKLDKEKEQLIAQKASLNIDNQILLIKNEIQNETEKKIGKLTRNNLYESDCKQFKLSIPTDSRSFNENYSWFEQQNKILPDQREALSEQKIRLKVDQDKARERIDVLQKQITSLIERKNRIPDDLIDARKRLVNILETTEDQIPFVGELLQVKSEEQKWEDAIERLLHNFSMQLLVPEKFIRAANQFIYTNDMRTKLVYQKIEKKIYQPGGWASNQEDLVRKLNFKESIYKDWIEATLTDRFNYFCTDDLEVFYGSRKAITSNGLIRNINRHEKDDRPGRWNKGKYRLGWDNRSTIQYLQQEKNVEEEKYRQLTKKIGEVVPVIAEIDNRIDKINSLLRYKVFDEIDWGRHAERITDLNRRAEELEKSSDAYRLIINQINELGVSLKAEKDSRDELIKHINTLETDSNSKNLRMLELEFEKLTETGSRTIESFLKEHSILVGEELTILQFKKLVNQTALKLKAIQKSSTDSINQLEKDIIVEVAAFVNPEERIIREFPNWSGDVMNISTDLSSLDDLEELYKSIQTQRLVEHKRRFKNYMDKSMMDALTSYRAWLENELDKIKDMIEELNVPLKEITFNRNPDTYLQLECKPVRGENEINIFKGQLNDAIPNVLEFAMEQDDNYREQVFQRINDLITELQREETWRRKVTDVRNWLTFGAREFSVADHKAEQYHDNTASYSGGQKAQFTYAILGAAIAYQFGIFQQGRQNKSLRFITVDEAFSKLDPEKSRFLMEFCEQLNLQILVVTPLDKINIAEPYIHSVHFVEIKNKKNSVLHNLTMERYYEEKENFKQLVEDKE